MKIIATLLLILASCTDCASTQPFQAIVAVSPEMSAQASEDSDSDEGPTLESGVAPMVEVSEFDHDHIKPLIDKLKSLDTTGYPEIIVRINTYGGSIHGGMQLIQAMEGLKTKITCVVDWRAMSMSVSAFPYL